MSFFFFLLLRHTETTSGNDSTRSDLRPERMGKRELFVWPERNGRKEWWMRLPLLSRQVFYVSDWGEGVRGGRRPQWILGRRQGGGSIFGETGSSGRRRYNGLGYLLKVRSRLNWKDVINWKVVSTGKGWKTLRRKRTEDTNVSRYDNVRNSKEGWSNWYGVWGNDRRGEDGLETDNYTGSRVKVPEKRRGRYERRVHESQLKYLKRRLIYDYYSILRPGLRSPSRVCDLV